MNVLCVYVKFHAWAMISKRDILVQKNKSEKIIFHIPESLISLSVYQCLHEDYFLIAYSFGYLMIQDRLQCKKE